MQRLGTASLLLLGNTLDYYHVYRDCVFGSVAISKNMWCSIETPLCDSAGLASK